MYRCPLLCCFLCFLSIQTVAQPTPRFTITQMISQSDQRTMGLSKLSQQEQIALEAWINIWTVQVVNHMLKAGCRCSADQCLNSIFLEAGGGQPQYIQDERHLRLNPRPQVQQRIDDPNYNRRLVDQGQDQAEITDILRDGALIKLTNGSVWEVSNYDRNRTARWQKYERVQLGAGRGVGDLTLYNINRRESVNVIRPGTESKILDPFGQNFYQEQQLGTIQDIRDDGKVILLDNGMTFTVPVGDRVRYTNSWRIGAVVQIDKLGGLNPYGLRNLDTGDQVRANLSR